MPSFAVQPERLEGDRRYGHRSPTCGQRPSINKPIMKQAVGRIGIVLILPIMVLVLDIFKDIRITPLIFPSK